MMKHMKKAISFLLAVCMLAGNSYVNTQTTTSVTMTEWTEKAKAPAEPLFSKGLLSYMKKNIRTASAADETPTPAPTSTTAPTPTSATSSTLTPAPTGGATGNIEGSYMFFDSTGGSSEIIKEGSTITITEEMKFQLTKINAAGDRIKFVAVIDTIDSSNTDIARVEKVAEDTSGYLVKITPVSPGTTSVMTTVTDILVDAQGSPIKDENGNYVRGSSHTFSCTVEVKLEIDKSDTTHWLTVGTDKKVLVLNQAESYQLQLRGVENKIVNSNLVKWNWPNDGIIEMDEATGTIHPKGAGVAKVSLKPITGNQKEQEFIVVVSPVGSADATHGYKDYLPTVPVETSSDSFTLYTNGNPASNMTWEVKQIVYNNGSPKEKTISQKDTSLLTYSISETDGRIQFTGVKAGTYKVIAYASKDYKNFAWNNLVFNITVNMTFQNTVKYVNVGDTYSIMANSNLPEGRFFDLINVDYVDPSQGKYIIGLDSKAGLVTALSNGDAVLFVRYRTDIADEGIYPPGNKNCDLDVTYTFHVIDEITLNATALTLYEDETYQLIANVTDRTEPVIWTSSDEKLVSVDENGLITAHKATGKTPVKITATQIVDGVVKSMVCEVFVMSAVKEVVLIPDNIILKLEEYETIKAQIKPAGANVSLTWMTSDPSIFQIVDASDTTVTIQAKSGGTAVLTALNADNIVVGYCKVTVNQGAQGISLKPSTITVPMSMKQYKLTAILTPATTTNKNIIWASQNTQIATVDQEGLVTFKKPGSVTISAQSEDNPRLITYCTIKIESSVSGLTLDYHDLELYVGDTKRLTYMLTPSTASHPEVTWTSFDTSIVAVDKTGMITAKGPGTTHIMLMSNENGSIYDICTVVVKQKATSVKMNYKELTMNRGEYFDMEVTIAPVNATEASLIWESLDTAVATVSANGRITARAEGTAIISVKTITGSISYCTVKVLEPVISLELDPTDIVIDVGEIFRIDPIFKPVAPTIKEVKWNSYNKSVATVNALGEVEGLSRGSTIVTCETVDGGFRAFCLVQVQDPDIAVTLSPEEYHLVHGKSITLEATVTNRGKVLENVPLIWESSDESICTVDNHGKVTGMDYGYATITVTVDDEYGATASCEIRVVKEDISVTLSPEDYRLGYGKSITLTATVIKRGEVQENVPLIWESSDETICVVDEYGKVTGMDYGYATITATVDDKYSATASCEIRVIREVTSIKFNHSTMTIVKGQNASLNADVQPSNATYRDVTLSSENEKVAIIDEDGMITAVDVGSTWIWAKTKDNSGKTARCYVTVINPIPVTGITVSDKKIVLLAGESKQLAYTVKPSNTTDEITWISGDEAIATVDGSGEVTARRTGSTIVTIMSTSGKMAQVEVVVMGLSRTKVELPVYTKYSKLTVEGATGTVSWDVDDQTICEVSNGVITARRAGTTYVTATVNGKSLRCKVTVTPNKKKK